MAMGSVERFYACKAAPPACKAAPADRLEICLDEERTWLRTVCEGRVQSVRLSEEQAVDLARTILEHRAPGLEAEPEARERIAELEAEVARLKSALDTAEQFMPIAAAPSATVEEDIW